jgi:hypothetical protein
MRRSSRARIASRAALGLHACRAAISSTVGNRSPAAMRPATTSSSSSVMIRV